MIYTTTCTGKDANDLKPLLNRLDARLVDIRFNPPEMPLKWSKTYLQLLLKRSYRHLPVIGAREIAPGRFAIQNLTLGIKILDEELYNILIFCDCAEDVECHRQKIAAELQKLGKSVEEISHWK